VSNFRCGVGKAPPAGIVAATHASLEATASDEREHHFLSMKAFSGVVDSGWSADEVCQWARLQDRFHHEWMEFVAAGDWGHSRQAETDHQLAHICMGLRDPGLLVRFSCEPDRISSCPVQTCEEALASLAGPIASRSSSIAPMSMSPFTVDAPSATDGDASGMCPDDSDSAGVPCGLP